MALDIIGITLLIVFFIRGYMKGLIVAAFSVLAVLLGLICALKLSEVLADRLKDEGLVNSGWAPLISYLVLFTGVMLLVRLIGKALESTMQAVMLGFVNKLAGGALYTFVTAVAWSILLWIGSRMALLEQKTIDASKTYAHFEPIAPWTFSKAGSVLPFARNVFSELALYFEEVKEDKEENVGTN